jgi:hypothetical protein
VAWIAHRSQQSAGRGVRDLGTGQWWYEVGVLATGSVHETQALGS